MKSLIRAVLAAVVLAAPVVSFAQSTQVSSDAHRGQGHTFDVFVDQPTGFTFVKMPGGWKFVGAASKQDTRHLPDTVLTTVLPADGAPEIVSASRK
jgi:hypothetical protein